MRFVVDGWNALLRELAPLEMPPEHEAAFSHYRRERLLRFNGLEALIVLGCTVLWWPFDWVIYRSLPRYIAPTALWREGVGLACVLYLLLRRVPSLRRRDDAMSVVFAVWCCGLMGYTAGLMSGPSGPHFHLLYILIFATVPLPLRLSSRVALTAAIAGSIAAGYFVPFAAHRASPLVPLTLSFLCCVMLLSTVFGHLLYHALRIHFHQGMLLEESNRLLEQRVSARTGELRALLIRLEGIREAERTRIARELHDELGQELTAQRLLLSVAEDCLADEPDVARAKLAEVRVVLDRTMHAVRALIDDLRPYVLDELGLGEAARWLARRTEERAGLSCSVSIEGDPVAIDRRCSTAAFRILQESLTNVVRHARATRVRIDLVATPEAVVLRVRDDGAGPRGLPQGSLLAHAPRGFGVLGMRERAQSLCGEFSLRSLPEGGTEVACRLPRAAPSDGNPEADEASEAL